jgi:hypothetical protein
MHLLRSRIVCRVVVVLGRVRMLFTFEVPQMLLDALVPKSMVCLSLLCYDLAGSNSAQHAPVRFL